MCILNEPDAYSYNSVTVKRNEDGSVSIHFGREPLRVNHLPIVEGWNCMVRFYPPRWELLDGTWTFPEVKPVASQ